MSEVIRVNRVNREGTRRVVVDPPPPLFSSLERFRSLQNNPVNPGNPPPPTAFMPLTDAERWPLPPFGPEAVTLATDRPVLTPEQAEAVTMDVAPQPVKNIAWVCTLAERYDAARPSWPAHLCERAACIDLLDWQRRNREARP